MGGPGSGRKPKSAAEHRRRSTWRRDRHGDRAGATGDARPELHSYKGHVLATADLPVAVGCAVVYALRADQSLTWADLPALVARLRR